MNLEQFEQMGIVFGDKVDDLFVEVQLPKGWAKVPTDHSMWSELIDDLGRVRARIFYKAAFYDRSAHISLVARYSYTAQPINGYDSPNHQIEPWVGIVIDCDEVIWQTDPMQVSGDTPDYEIRDQLRSQAKAWLEAHYPDYADPLAHW